MKTTEIYSRLKYFTESVLGISEKALINELPIEILDKVTNNSMLSKEDFVYFKERYNVNISYLLTGQLPLIRQDFKRVSNGLLSKSQIEFLTFLSKERFN